MAFTRDPNADVTADHIKPATTYEVRDALRDIRTEFVTLDPAQLVWEDQQGPALQGAGAGALTQEVYRDTLAVMLFTRHNQTDRLTFIYQMPHGWNPDTSVHLHAHLIPMVTPAVNQVARFEYRYAWGLGPTGALPAAASWTTGTADLTIPSDGSKTFFPTPLALVQTTPTGSKESSFLVLVFSRLGADAADTYATVKASGTGLANVAVLSVDAHYQRIKTGTVIEFPP